MRNKRVLLILALALLLIIGVGFVLIFKPEIVPIAGAKTLKGTVKTGAQIGRDYCSEGYYLEQRGTPGALLLRDSESEDMMDLFVYENREVRVTVANEREPKMYCQALTCACETRVLVTDIEML